LIDINAARTPCRNAYDNFRPAGFPDFSPPGVTGGAMKHSLPELPFAKNALEPEISAETIDYHYGKHHAAYVEKLNGLIPGTRYQDLPLEEIVKHSDGAVFNNAGQVWNHNFYWQCLVPGGPPAPRGDLAQAIEEAFGHVEEFKHKFNEAAAGNFGSGWTWLAVNGDGRLEIVNTGNAGTPITDDKPPLLTCDVWEHAYYIDYRNARPTYLQAFWKRVNWDFAERNFEAARRG
jgi:Fe-Mn family superoxide dismutase